MNSVETALYARLTGASALTALLAGTASVYNQLVPQGGAYPVVLFQKMSGVDDNETPHRARQLLYLVKGVSTAGPQEAGSIDDQIDAALEGVTISISGWTNFWTARESDVRFAEQASDNVRYWHAGGVYRLRITT